MDNCELKNLVEDRIRAEADIDAISEKNADPGVNSTVNLRKIPVTVMPEQVPSEFVRQCLLENERGDGALFVYIHQDIFRVNKNSGRFLIWAGHFFENDVADLALAAVENVAQAYLVEAGRVEKDIEGSRRAGDKFKANELRRYLRELESRVKRLRSRSGRENCLLFTHTIGGSFGIPGEAFDRQINFLACQNGIIELSADGFSFRPGRREDLITKHMTVEYNPEAERPYFSKFLSEIFRDDQAKIDFVQRLFGYALSGSLREHTFCFFVGRGRNGKNVLVDAIRSVMGSLVVTIKPEMILQQTFVRSSGAPSPDIMSLKGCRLAIASEIGEGLRINESFVKNLSGGDFLRARNLHDRCDTEFPPTHTLIVLTNYLPKVSPTDYAIWNRIQVVEFDLSFVSDPKEDFERLADKDLPAKLAGEKSGILNWLIEGYVKYCQEGLNPPPVVQGATEAYQRSEDALLDFLEECCFQSDQAWAKCPDVYARYCEWFRENVNSKHEPKQRPFLKLMAQRFDKVKIGSTYRFLGIGLLSENDLQIN